MENLQSDLINALYMAGEDFRADDIINTPRKNVMPDEYTRQTRYSSSNFLAMLKLEQRAIEEYGYNFGMPFLQIN